MFIFEGQKQPWDYYNAVRFGDKQFWNSVRNWRSIKIDEEQRGLSSTHCFWAIQPLFSCPWSVAWVPENFHSRFPRFRTAHRNIQPNARKNLWCQGYWSASKIYNLEYLFWIRSLRLPEIPPKDSFYVSRISWCTTAVLVNNLLDSFCFGFFHVHKLLLNFFCSPLFITVSFKESV